MFTFIIILSSLFKKFRHSSGSYKTKKKNQRDAKTEYKIKKEKIIFILETMNTTNLLFNHLLHT